MIKSLGLPKLSVSAMLLAIFLAATAAMTAVTVMAVGMRAAILVPAVLASGLLINLCLRAFSARNVEGLLYIAAGGVCGAMIQRLETIGLGVMIVTGSLLGGCVWLITVDYRRRMNTSLDYCVAGAAKDRYDGFHTVSLLVVAVATPICAWIISILLFVVGIYVGSIQAIDRVHVFLTFSGIATLVAFLIVVPYAIALKLRGK